jgi:formate C-acetyltransferase
MEINVKQFIYDNYTEYLGNEDFLSPISIKTQNIWNRCKKLLKQEQENGGVLDIESSTFSGINNFAPGYIDKDNEVIVGL